MVMEVLPPVVDTPMTSSNSSHSKITSEEVAQDVINGLRQNKKEVYVGKVWLLKMVHSISPSLADMIMRNESCNKNSNKHIMITLFKEIA